MKTILFTATMFAAVMLAYLRNPAEWNQPENKTERIAMQAGTGLKFGQTCISSTLIGSIYSKNAWTNTDDFIINGNSTATLSGNYINISSATQDNWNNVIHITNYKTKLEKWKFNLRFRLVAWAGNSYGIGIGLKSANENVQNDVMGFLQTTNAGLGGLYIVKSGRNTMAAGATPLNYNLNDIIELEGRFHDSVFHFTARNTSNGTSASVSYTYASNGSTHAVPNTSYFSLMELGGTHQVQSIEISSEEIAGSNIAVLGDSKTIGYFSNTFSGRYAKQLNNNYADVVINAGGADRVTHVLQRKEELLRLAPNRYLVCLGSNDLRFGSSLTELQANYDSLVRMLQATGAAVYHFLLPEDYTKPLGVNQLAFKGWLAATYPGTYINVWDSLAAGNLLKSIFDTGDGVHLNQAANNKIYEALVASNKLGGGISLPVKLLSFTAAKTGDAGIILRWQADPDQQAENYIIQKSRDGLYFYNLHIQGFHASAAYSYTDRQPFSGNNYYRLILSESTGEKSYSKVLLFKNNDAGPTIRGMEKKNRDEYLFRVVTPGATVLHWQVSEAGGKTIRKGSLPCSNGTNTLSIKLSHEVKGICYLKITDGKTLKSCSHTFIR